MPAINTPSPAAPGRSVLGALRWLLGSELRAALLVAAIVGLWMFAELFGDGGEHSLQMTVRLACGVLILAVFVGIMVVSELRDPSLLRGIRTRGLSGAVCLAAVGLIFGLPPAMLALAAVLGAAIGALGVLVI